MHDKTTARAILKSINRRFTGWRHAMGGRWDGWTFAALYPQVAAEYERAATVIAGRPVHYPAPPTRGERRGTGMPARIYLRD